MVVVARISDGSGRVVDARVAGATVGTVLSTSVVKGVHPELFGAHGEDGLCRGAEIGSGLLFVEDFSRLRVGILEMPFGGRLRAVRMPFGEEIVESAGAASAAGAEILLHEYLGASGI